MQPRFRGMSDMTVADVQGSAHLQVLEQCGHAGCAAHGYEKLQASAHSCGADVAWHCKQLSHLRQCFVSWCKHPNANLQLRS